MTERSDDREQHLSQLIRDHATRFRASPALESAIRTEIALQGAGKPARRDDSRWRLRPAWTFAGLGFACGMLLTATLHVLVDRSAEHERVATELVGSHVRALMASHLTDVASTDQHTVKPWFQGRISYSPPVKDLGREGYPLVGGRLDYLAGQAVAALVYRRNGHMINLFVWPDAGQAPNGMESRQGYNIVRWAADGMGYAAVSDLNRQELQAFAGLLND